MKAMIVLREKDWGWIRPLFPTIHPGLFPIANKPLLEYQVDFAIGHGCRAIRIVGEESLAEVEGYFGDGQRWGVEISYSTLTAEDGVETILQKNQSFRESSPLLFVHGMMFIHYDKNRRYSMPTLADNSGIIIPCGSGFIMHLSGDEAMKDLTRCSTAEDFSLSPLTTLAELFDLSLQVAESEQEHYVLPGYGRERHALLGQNVEIGKNVRILPPVIIGSNVRLLGEAVIGPRAIIGNEVIVDDGTHVAEAVVLDGSYLGRSLTVHRKLVAGDMVFDPHEDTALPIQDRFLFSSLHARSRSMGRYCRNAFLALLLATLQAIPFLLGYPALRLTGALRRKGVNLLGAHGKASLHLQVVSAAPASRWGRLFTMLALDKFFLLPMVLRGQLLLVGNKPLLDTTENRRLREDFPTYFPGLFAYCQAEQVASGSVEEEVCERYHAANRGFRHDLTMLWHILVVSVFGLKTAVAASQEQPEQ